MLTDKKYTMTEIGPGLLARLIIVAARHFGRETEKPIKVADKASTKLLARDRRTPHSLSERKLSIPSSLKLRALGIGVASSLGVAGPAAAEAGSLVDCPFGQRFSSDGRRCESEAALGRSRVVGRGDVGIMAAVDDKYLKIKTGTYAADVAAVSADSAVALGANANANNTSAVAIGGNTVAGYNAVSVGTLSRTGSESVAVGVSASANASNSVAVGRAALSNVADGVALGNTAQARAAGSVALGKGAVADRGYTVSIGTATQQRQIVNMAAGVQGTDAVNVSQLTPVVTALGGGASIDPTSGAVSSPSYTIGGTTVTNIGSALSNLDDRVTSNKGDVTNLTQQVTNLASGAEGIVTFDEPSGTVNVAMAQGGSTVSFAGVEGNRTLTGVSAGVLAADSFEAINGSQLFATNERLTTAEGDIMALDGRVTTNEGDVTNLTQQVTNLVSGAEGIVTFDQTTGTVKVAEVQGGGVVDFRGGDGTRVLSGIGNGVVDTDAVSIAQLRAAGALDPVSGDILTVVTYDDISLGRATLGGTGGTVLGNVANGVADQDAVNVRQLTGTAQSIASALGGGSAVNADGTLSSPSYSVGGSNYGSVGEAVAAVDGTLTEQGDRITINEGEINTLNTAVSSLADGTLGIVTYDQPTGTVKVAAAQAGLVVDFAGTAGARTLTNVANGRIGAGSLESINGGQLFEVNNNLQDQLNQMGGRVGDVEQSIADGTICNSCGGGGGGGDAAFINYNEATGSVGIGPGAAATGDNSFATPGGSATGNDSLAIGSGASATGNGSAAVGQGASASGSNSMALGNGSVADRDNEVAVGSSGNERIVSSVAAGTRPTDAVNLQQLDDRFQEARDYTDNRLRGVDRRMDRMAAVSAAYAGMAMNTAGLQGRNRMGVGLGAQNGREALAVGYQRIVGQGNNASVSLGGAFSGDDKSLAAGAGFSW